MKTLLLALLYVFSYNSFALRCQNTLIDVGSLVGDVMRCEVVYTYRVHNNSADQVYIIVKEGKLQTRIDVIDGVVIDINIL